MAEELSPSGMSNFDIYCGLPATTKDTTGLEEGLGNRPILDLRTVISVKPIPRTIAHGQCLRFLYV